MKKILLFIVLLLVTVLLLGGCFPSFIFESMMTQNSFPPQEYFDEQEDFENYINGPVDPYAYQYEALDWLTKSANPNALAKSRFRNTDEAIGLVKALYERDAIVVLVTGITQDADLKKAQDKPYADTLIVVLPKDIHSRAAIQTLYRREVNLYGCNEGSEEAGMMGDTLMMSWYDIQED